MPCRSRRRRPARRRTATSLAQALALGALHGPAELLPISSSAHVSAVPWLLDWSYARLDDDLRKSFEVALHAGAAAAWLVSPATRWGENRGRLVRPSRPDAAFLILAVAPPAVAGLALERPIERRLGTPATLAGGLVAGALAMVMADRAPQTRDAGEARGADGAWLGLAQAAALLPGVSRSGATLTAARVRGFTRPAAQRLSIRAGMPVLLGATGLKLVRSLHRSSDEHVWLAAGALASFLSTLLLAPLVARTEDKRPLAPFAAYRVALAGAIVVRLLTGRRGD